LHQGASVSMTASPKMATTMVTAMLVMTLGFWMYSIAVTLARMRCVIVERERQPSWGKNSSIHEVAEAR
jgi:heme exporter protein C